MNLQLSANIKKLRKENNLTQDELATELGISYQAVSRWETGTSYPDVEMLPALASIFGVSMDILFGVDEQSEEQKIRQYRAEIDQDLPIDEYIKITRQYMSELPANTYLKYRLIAGYKVKSKKGELSPVRLEEMRKHCNFIIDHTTDMDWWRDEAIGDMICIETDEYLDVWLTALDNRTIISSEKALINRYDHRNEIDKYNEAIQKDIIESLTQMFDRDFCKRDAKTNKNARSRAEGQKLILKTIDIFRDPTVETDGWLSARMFAYMRLSAGEFGSGNIEEGYAALEKAVDLYIEYEQLAEGTELKYNCPALDMITFTVDKGGSDNCREALQMIQNWAWFKKVRGESRFIEQVERLKKYCAE